MKTAFASVPPSGLVRRLCVLAACTAAMSYARMATADTDIILCEPFNPAKPVTCGFACYAGHEGLDYAVPQGTDILLPVNGTLTALNKASTGQTCTLDFGNYVKVTQGDFEVILAHMSQDIPLSKGPVNATQLAGHVSNTGYTLNGNNQCNSGGGYHLHLEVRKDGVAINPKNHPLVKWGGSDCGGPTPCPISPQSTTTIEDDQGCLERGGEFWWDAEDENGHSYTTYTTDSSKADSYGKYRLSFEQAGNYQVDVCIPNLQNLSQNATYRIQADGNIHTATLSQASVAGNCATLGSFSFAEGGAQYVQLNDNTGEKYIGSGGRKIAFDAISLTPQIGVGSCATPPCEEGVPDPEPDTDSTGSGDSPTANQATGCAMSRSNDTPSSVFLLLCLWIFALRRRRWSVCLTALMLGTLPLTGCHKEQPSTTDPDDLGYVEIDGRRMNLVPIEEQVWEGLNETDWDPDPVFGQDLPDVVDHAAFQTLVRQQGESLTCVDYATVAGMESFAYFQPMEDDLSEAQLAALHEQKSLQATLMAAASSKLTTEALWPAGALSGVSGWQAQAHYGILIWKAIANPTNIDGLRARIAEGDKINVLLSLSHVATAWKLNGKIEPVEAPVGSWAHAILLVGYKRMLDSNNKQKWFFHFKNSWGVNWGESGYGWISQDYITKHGLQAAVVRSVTQSPASDACANVSCGKCLKCADGLCVADTTQDGKPCGNGLVCSNGGCIQPDDCANVQCGVCLKCSGGICIADLSKNGSTCGPEVVCENGACVSATCTPDCSNKCGGAWDECNGECNSPCPGGATCINQQCVACGDAGEPCCNGLCNGGILCNAGLCGTCGAPNVVCNGMCASLASDPANCGSCGHSCLGGLCQASKCQPVTLASGQDAPVKIAVDALHVYWTNGYGGTVMKVPIAGGNPQVLASGPPAFGIAVDATSVYWTTSPDGVGTGAVMKLPLAGGDPQTLAAGQQNPTAIAVDANSVYWIENAAGRVNKVPKNGGTTSTLYAGISFVAGIAVDSANVYWTNYNINPNSLMKVPINGGAPTTLATWPSGQPGVLAVDGASAYWGDLTMSKVATGGGSATLLVPEQGNFFGGVTVDATNVYFTTGYGEQVMRVPLDGGPLVTLAANQSVPLGIAVDATSIYWANNGYNGGGAIVRLAK